MSTRARRIDGGDGLFIVGLVGSTGSGKSTVAHALERDGAVVIEADRVGHQVTDRDPEVRAALEAEYGADIYRADGKLDRARVAARVFADAGARARLDRLVHPRLVSAIRERIEKLRAGGHRGVVVIDAALLLDWELEREVDAVLAVAAPDDARVARLQASRGWSEDEVRRRLAAQKSPEAFRRAADWVIDNLGSLDDLAREARAALAILEARRDAGRAPRKEPC